MKKYVLIALITLSLSGPSFAMTNAEGMKILTINALMNYGQKLYDRGDYSEASAVFNHVLVYDSHQPEALKYLKSMGYFPDVNDAQSLQKAIGLQQHIIEKLQGQIIQLRNIHD